MKKVIGIIDPGWVEYTDTSDLLKGRGGSETWTVQLSAKLQERGYHVIVFCKVKDWHFNAFGVEWVPINLLYDRIEYQKFDHIIISRRLSNDRLIKLSWSDCCDNIWIQAHDTYISSEDSNEPLDLSSISYNPKIKGVICLTEAHRKFLIKNNKLLPQYIHMTGNGLEFTPFNDLDYDKFRSFNLFYSSRPERGLEYMIKEIMPRIREVHPESRLRVASYDDIPVEGNYDYVDYLGRLTKEQLYKEMSNCRVWLYPAIFPETFCITALENIMCGCIPIVPRRDGMETTFGPFKGMMTPDIPFEYSDNYDLMTKKALYYMDNYDTDSVRDLRECLMTHIESNYTWDIIVKKFEQIWN